MDLKRRIRKNAPFQDIPIIVLTAYTSPFHYQAALRAGGNYIIEKPVDFEELKELINSIPAGGITTQRRTRLGTTEATPALHIHSPSQVAKQRVNN